MPYISEKIRLSEKQDRRVKLLAEDKKEIKKLYATGLYSLNSLARQYNVSKKTILLIVNPESKRKSDERIKEHWKDYATKGEERNAIMREYRHYKQSLYLKGELK